MSVRGNTPQSVIVVIADGFEETDAVVLVSLLRQAGLCVKSVGLTSGLICSAHGIWVMPDLTIADLDRPTNTTSVSTVILPEGRQGLARLEADPRVHRLLRRVVAHRGQIVTSAAGMRVPRAAAIWDRQTGDAADDQWMPVVLRDPGQSPEALALDLIRMLKRPVLV